MKAQNKIWQTHTLKWSVEDIVKQYNSPAIFQTELSEYINRIISKNNYISSIELGCETGVTSMLLSNNIEKTFLDLNEHAIELCQSACDALNIKGAFLCRDMFNTKLPQNSYDIVFNAGVVEHFKSSERVQFFKEYKRIMSEKGKMIIAFPNHYSLPYRTAYIFRRYILLGTKWPYPREFKIYNLAKDLEKAGLILEDRITLSKKSLFNWWNLVKPIKKMFSHLDKKSNYEGYLTVLLIRKGSKS